MPGWWIGPPPIALPNSFVEWRDTHGYVGRTHRGRLRQSLLVAPSPVDLHAAREAVAEQRGQRRLERPEDEVPIPGVDRTHPVESGGPLEIGGLQKSGRSENRRRRLGAEGAARLPHPARA